MNQQAYRVRPPVSKLFYALLLSLGISFVGWKAEEIAYQMVGALVALTFIFLLIQYFFPRKLILAEDHVIIPGLIPSHSKRINFHSVNSHLITRFKGTTYLYFQMKNKQVHSVEVASIERWDDFYSRLRTKIPSNDNFVRTPPSPRLMKYLALLVWILVGFGVKFEWLDEKTAIMAGGAATGIIVMAMIAGRINPK